MDKKDQVWNRYLCMGCGRGFNDNIATLLHYSRLSLIEIVPLPDTLLLRFLYQEVLRVS